MECRENCGACCLVPEITRSFWGMPQGKPAGTPCVHLSKEIRCSLFGDPRRPSVCDEFQPETPICGSSREEAFLILNFLEISTAPERL